MKQLIAGGRTVPGLLWRIPFRLCLLVTLLLHVIGEEYPFSDFPMYSNFQNDARVAWIADQDGKPVASSEFFGLRVSTIKKILDRRMRDLAREGRERDGQAPPEDELARQAAALVLEELWQERRSNRLEAAGITEIRLMEQEIRFADNLLHETERLLAVRELPAAGPERP